MWAFFSSCGEWGLLSCCGVPASRHGGFSDCRLNVWSSIVGARGLSSFGSRAIEHRLGSCRTQAYLLHSTWDLPGDFFQARSLERVSISSSRGSSWPRDRTCVSCTGRQILYRWASGEAWLWSRCCGSLLSPEFFSFSASWLIPAVWWLNIMWAQRFSPRGRSWSSHSTSPWSMTKKKKRN